MLAGHTPDLREKHSLKKELERIFQREAASKKGKGGVQSIEAIQRQKGIEKL